MAEIKKRVKPNSCPRPFLWLFMFVACSGLFEFIIGPTTFQRLKEDSSLSQSSCLPCLCNCFSHHQLHSPALGKGGADCERGNLETNEETEKQRVELLIGELELQRVVTNDSLNSKKSRMLNVMRDSLKYKKEGDKCKLGMENCEETRARAEAEFVKERKLTAMWESRAKQLGWSDSITCPC